MRVLHVIPTVSTHDGGPTVAVRAMASGVSALDAEVTVATTDVDGSGRVEHTPGVPVIENGVEFRYFTTTLPGAWKFSWPLTRWLYANVSRYDVVHVHALFSYATIPACRIAKAHGVPYIVRPLGTLEPWSLGQKRWKKTPYFQVIERDHLRYAAAIHVTSEREKTSIDALQVESPTVLIPLGVEPPSAGFTAEPSGSRSLRLVFLSRLHPKKGLPLLFSAMHELRSIGMDVKLIIAGGGTLEYEGRLRDQVRELKLEGTIDFVGRVEGVAKWSLLASADVFVLPSYQENFGIAVVEALAAGLPVVISDQVGVAPAVAAAGAGVVVPCEARALAAALRALADDVERRAIMARNGRRLARDQFSWSRCCRRLHDLYSSLARERSRGGCARLGSRNVGRVGS